MTTKGKTDVKTATTLNETQMAFVVADKARKFDGLFMAAMDCGRHAGSKSKLGPEWTFLRIVKGTATRDDDKPTFNGAQGFDVLFKRKASPLHERIPWKEPGEAEKIGKVEVRHEAISRLFKPLGDESKADKTVKAFMALNGSDAASEQDIRSLLGDKFDEFIKDFPPDKIETRTATIEGVVDLAGSFELFIRASPDFKPTIPGAMFGLSEHRMEGWDIFDTKWIGLRKHSPMNEELPRFISERLTASGLDAIQADAVAYLVLQKLVEKQGETAGS